MTPTRPAARASVVAGALRRRRALRARRRRRLVAFWLVAALGIGLVSFVTGLLVAPVTFADTVPPKSAVLVDEHGRTFATIRSPEIQQRVTSSQIPQVMKEAIVAAEDSRFYQNAGIDPLALARALWKDLTGSPTQGGSTITQQYVKNVYTGSQRTVLRKLREAALAIRIEQHFSKDEILTRYLNTLYLGNGTYGVQAASTFYFGVKISDLDLDPVTHSRSPVLALARAAVLAGIVPAPSIWNPVHDPAAARSRELYTLNRLVATDVISPAEASAAYGIGLPRIVAETAPGLPTVAPEFRDLVEQVLNERYAATPNVVFAGLTVRTTLDLTLQQAVVQALHEVLPKASDPEAAVVAIDPRNGDIRALAEKKDGGYSAHGFDLAEDASRSSGSTIKPFTLAVALEEHHQLGESVYAPRCFPYPDDPGHCATNADPAEAGYYTLEAALWHSINTVYLPLALKVGLPKVLALAHAAGMSSGTNTRNDFAPPYNSAKALGVAVTPESEAVAYSTLLDHGVRHDPRAVLAISGPQGSLYTAPAQPAGRAVLPAGIADEVTGAMLGVVDQGTGTAAQQPFPVYGKTGTTSNYVDAWFTGCTPTLCITVWMGYDRSRAMVNVEGQSGDVFGGTFPAEIFARAWANYRALGAPPVTQPSPVITPPAPVAPTSPATRSPLPKSTKSASASPRPVPTTRSPAPSPTVRPTPKPTLVPTTAPP
ncbi:MAG TPA: transglycosylase domain-containing protein [Mycobacteriales bacterium]|nr:transglycosylase domain-containing protein [Mycobacteriales bacterium]